MSFLFRRSPLLGVVAIGVAAVFAPALPAGAHTELVASDPAEGATVAGPLEHVTLEFLNPVVALGDQFELLDGSARPVPIASIDPEGETTTVQVVPAEALDAGAYGLRWVARAGDSHPRDGTITFTVEVAVAPTTAPTGVDPTVPPPDSSSGADSSGGSGSTSHQASALHDALAEPDTTVPSSLATALRFFMYTGLLLAVGGILYLALVHRGTRQEGRRLVVLVRRAAMLTIVATLLELPVQAILVGGGSGDAIADPNAYSDLLGGDFGVGVLLRIAGALLVLGGLRMQLRRLDAGLDRVSAGDEPTLEHLAPFGGGGVATRTRAQPTVHSHRVRVEASPMAMLGALALVASELFIGHSASTEPRWLVVASTAAHIVAAGVWVAGLAMLAITLWGRHRRGAELEAALLASRFSIVAIGAVVAVALTGVVLGIAILGDLAALTSTEFGRLLLVKVSLVVVLVALGGYNQRIVIPSLERRRTSRRAGHRLRRVVTAEVVTFLAIVAVTAALVGADSTG